MENLHATRPCAFSGSFYSSDKSELSSQVKTLLNDAKDFTKENVNAIIVPHAGYIYSAKTAATSYKTLHKKYKNIFLIGSSHHVNINGASIYNLGNYKTPLGEVKVNQEIVSDIMKNTKLFSYNENAHNKEHTLEVQIPFLQAIYGDELSIVPIIVATSDINTIKEISKSLAPYFNDDNLFVISTDLSHFPSYEDANIADKRTLNSMATNNTQKFIDTLIQNESLGMYNLQTSACGWASVLTLMYLTENKNYTYEVLDYKNSGDTEFGDKNRVVGYGAIRIYHKTKEFLLDANEKEELINIAKLSLHEAIKNNQKIQIDEAKVSKKLKLPLGAFVTLYKHGNLRGCIGRFEPDQPLYSVVVDMAIASALQDTRFNKVSVDELADIKIEVSVLTPRKKINSIDEIVIGKHGIYVKKGLKNGTYLPHVATQMGWNVEEFIKSCAIEKAGMNSDEINDMEIFIYEAIVFKE